MAMLQISCYKYNANRREKQKLSASDKFFPPPPAQNIYCKYPIRFYPEKKRGTLTLKTCILCLHILEGWSGVERVCADICKGLMGRGHDITLAVREPKKEATGRAGELLTRIPDGVKMLRLGLWDNEKLHLAKEQLKAEGFEAAIGMLGYDKWPWYPWLFAGSGVPLIAWEHNPPDIIANKSWHPYGYFGTMAAMDSVHVLLRPYIQDFPEFLRDRIGVIGNPIYGMTEAKRPETVGPPVLLGVGRFDEGHKGFALLIQAFGALAAEFPEWRLKLVGDGPGRIFYEALVKALNITDRVDFTGAVPNASEFYAQAELFCMPSRFEAFGLVLAEAASYELPLVGLSTCVSAGALIQPGCGALAAKEDHQSLTEAIRPIMAMTPEERRAMGRKAKEFFIENYSPEKIFDACDRALADTVRKVKENKQTRLEGILRNAPKDVKTNEMDGGIMSLELEMGEWIKKHQALNKKLEGTMATLGQMIIRRRAKEKEKE
jgi:glycosyltransferase involved in cell wall biosynthesis